jgi:hypothetical protein
MYIIQKDRISTTALAISLPWVANTAMRDTTHTVTEIQITYLLFTR